MSDTEPEHVFRVERHDEPPLFIAADSMTVDPSGIMRFHNGMTTVGILFPCAGLTVIRVDALITKEATPT